MIGRLHGKLIDKKPPELLIDVGGVGYEVSASMHTIYQLPELDHHVTLYTHLTVREDAHLLFGFAELEERELFRLLIKVNGVGPKLALTILSSMAVDSFVECVHQDNVTALVKVPGIGKKTAERLLIEMRDKLKDWQSSTAQSPTLNNASAAIIVRRSEVQDAISALIALGYKPAQANQAVAKLDTENANSEQIIRQALQRLAG